MKKAGKAVSVLMTAVLAAGITSPAVFAASAPYVQSDTTIDFTVPKSNTYAFKFTIHGSHSCPNIVAGNGAVLRTENTVKRVESGNDVYYFKVRAIGSYGQSSAIYTTLPGQKAVKHCTIKVGVKTHDDNYYDDYDSNGAERISYTKKIKQQFINYMSLYGYKYNSSLDSLNRNTTPSIQGFNDSELNDKTYRATHDNNGNPIPGKVITDAYEQAIQDSAKDLAGELKKHKTAEYGIDFPTYNIYGQVDSLAAVFHSNLNYTVNPEPDFTSKFYDGAEGGKNLGCDDYACSRGYEITGIAAGVGMSDLENAVVKGEGYGDFSKLKKDGFSYGYEPKKDAIVYESNSWLNGVDTGHWEYVEAVDGDSVTVSGANTNSDGKYYGRVVRTKKELQDLGAVYLYLK